LKVTMASSSHLVALFLLLLACVVRMQDEAAVDEEEEDVMEEDDNVIVITTKNFDEVLATHPYLLVEFCKFVRIPWNCILTLASRQFLFTTIRFNAGKK